MAIACSDHLRSACMSSIVLQVEIDEGHRPGVTTAEAQRTAELERENREQRATPLLFDLSS
jgi:transposase